MRHLVVAAALVAFLAAPVVADFPEKVTIDGKEMACLAVAEVRKLGLPCEDIPWKDNAARVYIEAMNAHVDPPDDLEADLPDDPDVSVPLDVLDKAADKLDFTGHEELARAYLEGNARYFALVEEADGMPRFVFPQYRGKHAIDVSVSGMSGFMQMGRHLVRRAAFAFWQGRQREAIDVCFISLRVGRRMAEQPYLVNGLVGMAIQMKSFRLLADMVASGKFDDATLRDLADRLARPGMLPDYLHAVRTERVFSLLVVDELAKHGLDILDPVKSLETWEPITPQDKDERETWHRTFRPEETRRHVGAVYDFLEARARMPVHIALKPENRFDVFQRNHEAGWDRTTRMLNSDGTDYLPAFARAHVQRDALCLRVALERYRRAHRQYPETLDALAPEYLAKPPTDPFSAKPYRYKRDAEKGFILWSIGQDLKDDGGVSEGDNPWAGPDHVFTSKQPDEPEDDD